MFSPDSQPPVYLSKSEYSLNGRGNEIFSLTAKIIKSKHLKVGHIYFLEASN